MLPFDKGYLQFSLNGTFKMAANCCQRMSYFGLVLPISFKPVGGIPSHLGHKFKEKGLLLSAPVLKFVLLGASYSVFDEGIGCARTE